MSGPLTIGVLAFQGAVEEHISCLSRLGCEPREDLDGLDGLVLPGGESTAIATLVEREGIVDDLRAWVHDSKPVWGTCAGLVLLSEHTAKSTKHPIGGLDARVCRNYFGPQLNSCEEEIATTEADLADCKSIFIRAPAVLEAGPHVQVLGTTIAAPHRSSQPAVAHYLSTHPHQQAPAVSGGDSGFRAAAVEGAEAEVPALEVAVAVQQGNILATAFHPELTADLRWHRRFLDIVRTHKAQVGSSAQAMH